MKWVCFTEQSLILVLVLLLSSSTSIRLSESADRLSSGESISGNQTIVSAGETFTLGFFTPANSSSNLYLGIWYNKINSRRIIWVANRETPVRKSTAVFRISGDSNLVVSDSRNGILVWSSNISSSTVATNGTSAVLLDSGNLVLQNGNDSTTLWQSFDFPTDTLLPGMMLWSNRNTGTSKTISSWKDAYDPAPGNFSFGIDALVPYQLLTKRGSEPFWRSQVWTGSSFSALLAANTISIFYMTYTTDGLWNNVTLSLSDPSVLSCIRLNHTGFLEQVEWEADSATWALLTTLPQLVCDTYGLCGPFGYCDAIDSSSTCKCLEGFEPRSQDDWEKSIFNGGCVRKIALGCEDRKYEFLTYNQMKLPDHAVVVLNTVNMSECQKVCITNCSCTAYTYSDSTNSSRFSACYVWFGEIIDLVKVPAGGKDLYVRIAGSDSGRKRGSSLAVILIVTSVVMAIICVAFVYLICKRNKRRYPKRSELLHWEGNMRYNREVDTSNSSGFGDEVKQDLPLFSSDSLMAATENFNDSYRIGQGGFGIVYMAKLKDGQEFAIKRLSKGSGQGLEEFKNEVTLIAKLQHRNLVRLMGYCVEREERILVYEYMPNNSLDSFLLDREKSMFLDWEKRFKIIKGIARGLLYLHQDSRLRIIHRDLKAGNILLDKDMNPKISDFGMARIFGGDQNQANTNRVVGTYGYISPEYAMKGHFSAKSDVYSYGVLILEILSGIKNTGLHLPQGFSNLLSYAWKLWDEKITSEMIDSSIVLDSSSSEDVARCILVGLLCVQDRPSDRPTMSSVVFMLENGSTPPDSVPKRPTFTTEVEDVVEADEQHFPIPTRFSVNDVTITVTHGR